MSSLEKQHRWLTYFFPGLIDAVKALGDGKFEHTEDTKLTLKTPPRDIDHVRDVQVGLFYKLDDGHTIEIRTHQRLKDRVAPHKPGDAIIPGTWDRYRYAFDYRKTGEKICLFRFDLDDNNGHHVHFSAATPADKRDHVPAADVIPDTTDIDPEDFVKVVAKFRDDKKYPMTRKTP